MEETKIAIPAWLPWATTACLAVFASCLWEILAIEKTRTQLVRDENLLIEAEVKSSQNQLEAERIVGRRELQQARLLGTHRLEFFSVPDPTGSAQPAPGDPWGVVTWDASATHAKLRFAGLPSLAPDRDFQVWIEGQSPRYPLDCGGFHTCPAAGFPVDLPSPVDGGYRILLIDGKKGGATTLDEVVAGGSIVLATHP